VQEDFISPTGAAGHWGIDMAMFEPPLAKIEQLIAAGRAAGLAEVFVRVVTSADTDSNALKLLHQRKGRPPEALGICRAGTPGADYYRIKPQAGDIEIAKTLYSSFSGTDLDAQLKARGIDTLVVVGFTTECCVESTARDAFHHNYSVFVVTDACAAYEEALHYGSLNALAKNCALLTDTASVLAAWAYGPAANGPVLSLPAGRSCAGCAHGCPFVRRPPG
jgi:nicotinamidase-related amidase